MWKRLRRANARAKDVWNDPKWHEPKAPSEVEQEVRRRVDERLAPVVDQDGNVWRRTLNGPPPWR